MPTMLSQLNLCHFVPLGSRRPRAMPRLRREARPMANSQIMTGMTMS